MKTLLILAAMAAALTANAFMARGLADGLFGAAPPSHTAANDFYVLFMGVVSGALCYGEYRLLELRG